MKGLALTALGFVLGLAFCILPEAQAQPRHDESEHIQYAEVQCRGNGSGGYRKCMLRFQRPAHKVVLDVYVGDRYDLGLVWRPERGQWKVVK